MLLLPVVGSAQDVVEIDGIYYKVIKKGKVAEVTSNPNKYSGSVNIPANIIYDEVECSVTSIGESAFYWCSGLTSVTIPGSVTSIGNFAFYKCSGLTSVTIPNSVTSIGHCAFSGCSGLTSVTIPNSVTSIGYDAFSGCSGLTSITIPNSVTSIGGSAFYGTGWYNDQSDGILYLDNWLIGIKGETPTGELIITEGTRGIAGSAFYYRSGLTSVTIPNSVTSIGNAAFYECSGLTNVTIPGSVTNIENYAFTGCTGITSVRVTVTDYSAFCENKALGYIYSRIGKPVQLINNENVEITDYVVPDDVASIGNSAFINCTGLTSVTIPGSVTSIGNEAFSGCTALMTVKSYITEPFNISKFENDTYRQGTLYVPKGTKDLYIRFDGWREFLKIEEMEREPAPNGECAMPTIIVMGNKFKFQCETPGAVFTSTLTMEKQFTGDEVVMDTDEVTYLLTVYANAPDYDQSRPAKYRFTVSKSDVNQDGKVNVADIATIISKMAGK